MGAYNFARKLNGPEDEKRLLLRTLSEAKIAVGCVAEPGASEAHSAIVATLARDMGGVVFDGRRFLDGDGRELVGTPSIQDT